MGAVGTQARSQEKLETHKPPGTEVGHVTDGETYTCCTRWGRKTVNLCSSTALLSECECGEASDELGPSVRLYLMKSDNSLLPESLPVLLGFKSYLLSAHHHHHSPSLSSHLLLTFVMRVPHFFLGKCVANKSLIILYFKYCNCLSGKGREREREGRWVFKCVIIWKSVGSK